MVELADAVVRRKTGIDANDVTFKDGSTQIISTGTDWKIKEGPVRRNCIYEGETYDVTRETEGWDKPGFDDFPGQMPK
jgi:hypothetical protein